MGKALDANFDDFHALFILGYVFIKMDAPGLAYQLVKRCIDSGPDDPEMCHAWHNMGKAFYEVRKVDEAERCWRKALSLKPDMVNSLDGMGLVNLARSNYGAAIHYTNRALSLEPDIVDSHVNRGMAYLALRRWKQGWEDYNWNLGVHKDRRELKYGDEPRWDGSHGKNLVIYGEQGIGDEISFASCIPDAIRDSRSVTIECDERLKGVFSRSFPGCEVHGTRYKKERPWTEGRTFDARQAIGGLPAIYRNTDADFPGTPYLIPDPQMRIQWKALLDSLGSKPKIGIAWTGGRPHTGQSKRSLSLEQLLPVLRYDAHWISLQYKEADDIQAFTGQHGIIIHHWPWAVESYNYDQTFALIAELDLVITVTTTVVHAAGAIGKECWCLVPREVMWRYLEKGSEFPWAKSVTMFRQNGADWPMWQIAQKLKERFGDHTARNGGPQKRDDSEEAA